MERAGNGQPGVGGPPGGGIRVIDNVSSRRDVYTPENPQVTTKGDRTTTERQSGSVGATCFKAARSQRMLTQTRVFARVSLHEPTVAHVNRVSLR